MAEFCHPEFGCDCSELTAAEKEFLLSASVHIRNEFPATAETLREIAERRAQLA